jgi:putative sterol carrier protein
VFIAIAEGKTSAMQSWHNGALKVSGDMAAAQVRLPSVLQACERWRAAPR